MYYLLTWDGSFEPSETIAWEAAPLPSDADSGLPIEEYDDEAIARDLVEARRQQMEINGVGNT